MTSPHVYVRRIVRARETRLEPDDARAELDISSYMFAVVQMTQVWFNCTQT